MLKIVVPVWLAALTALAAAKRPSGLAALEQGQRVKVEGRIVAGSQMIARSVKAVPEEDSFEVEGLVRKLDIRSRTFAIGFYTVLLTEKTRLENSRREPVDLSEIAEGKRVKVKARVLEAGGIKARTVRVYENSQDTDLEITARIDEVDAARSEIKLLAATIRIDRRTEFALLNGAAPAIDDAAYRYIRRDDDEQHPDPIRIGNVYLGGRAGFEHVRTRNFDLDEAAPDSNDWLIPGTELEIAAPLGEFSEAYTKLNFSRPFAAGNDPNAVGRADFNVREAFLYVGNFLHPSMGLQIGRQRFRDRREWLYDDELDAARLHLARSNLKLEAAAAKGLIGPTGSRSDQYYFIASSQYRLPGRRYVGAYLLKRNDLTSRDEDPIWYGLSSRGRVWRHLDYWGELARMKGRRAARLLRGYGYDLGLTQRFPVALQPAVSLGYAFGSGDSNLEDGIDGNFRQTGLQDNSYRYNGLKRFRYYGVLLEPELNNIRITTADLGFRGAEAWSLNVSFHTYRQAVPSRRLGDSEITLRPRGRDPRLGKEFDVVFAVRKIRNLDLNFYAGLFVPGPAFSGSPRRAFSFRQELKYYF